MPLSTASRMAYNASNLYANQQLLSVVEHPYAISTAGAKQRGMSVAPSSEGAMGTMTVAGQTLPSWAVYAGGAAALGALYWFFLRK